MKLSSFSTLFILAASSLEAAKSPDSSMEVGKLFCPETGQAILTPLDIPFNWNLAPHDYVSCVQNSKVMVQFGEKLIQVDPNFNNPSKMIEDMKTKLRMEIDDGNALTFSISFSSWTSKKYDMEHHLQKYSNKSGLIFIADRTENKITLTPKDYPPIDQKSLNGPFIKDFLAKEWAERQDEREKMLEWLTAVKPLPADHPLLKKGPGNGLNEMLTKHSAIVTEAAMRRRYVVSLYDKVVNAGLNPREVFGWVYYNRAVAFGKMSGIVGARLMLQAYEGLSTLADVEHNR